jgi:hypothetical protein
MTLDLDAIEARANAASTGPWRINTSDKMGEDWLIGGFGLGRDDDGTHYYIVTTDGVRASRFDNSEGAKSDAEFIAAARTDVPALIERIRELEGVRNEEMKR